MKCPKFTGPIRAETIAAVLLFFTIIMWLAYEFLMNKTFVLDAKNSDFLFSAVYDCGQGGNSTAKVVKTDSTILLEYELKPGVPYPFATLHLDPNFKDKKGIDLSRFEEIRVLARFQGPGNQRVRLHIRNAHPKYADEADSISLKYNEVHLPKLTLNTPVILTWQHFQVPGWWIAQQNIPFEQGTVDVRYVRWIEFITPEQAPTGKGLIEFRKIEFRGKHISPDYFFKMLLVVWMFVWATFTVLRISNLMRLLRQKEAQEKELLKLNQILSIQTDEFKKKAQRDELTGLLNRHGLRDRLFQTLEEVRSKGNNLSVIFVDIDHFKRINDALGHSEGDRILRVLAATLVKNIRECDIPVRWGGEEFLVLFPVTLKSAIRIAEKLRGIICNLPEKITCSIGVSSMSKCDFQAALQRADKALYEAKNRGRNRVVSIDTD